ncbi:Meiotically up-regulated protein 190 [Exophiala dermatitidis]
MSAVDDIDPDSSRTNHQPPHTARHPIPTIQRYKAERSELNDHQQQAEEAQHDEGDEPTVERAYHAAKNILKGEDPPKKSQHDPYRSENRNIEGTGQPTQDAQQQSDQDGQYGQTQNSDSDGDDEKNEPRGKGGDDKGGQSATEAVAASTDPRQKRKAMKHKKRDEGGREVTDPVTHLPIVIRDSTRKDLKSTPQNYPAYGSQTSTLTGVSGAKKSQSDLEAEQSQLQSSHNGMQKLFPPPSFDEMKVELNTTYQLALTLGLSCIVLLVSLCLILFRLIGMGHATSYDLKGSPWTSLASIGVISIIPAVTGFAVIVALRGWLGKKVDSIWNDEVWDAARKQERQGNEAEDLIPESVTWLNNLLAAVWPLINPDLFTSIADMLEDVMQASLPKVVRMVSVDDLGQGSEAFRILGVNWLPTGAASRTVGANGKLKPAEDEEKSDRASPGQGQIEGDDSDDKDNDSKSGDKSKESQQDEQEQQAIREGMEAEQGDFVNLELAFAYRARSSGKSLQAKAKNAHLYLKFYLPGGIVVPVWVELKGIVGTMRLRLQLTPDPPFFSLCTLTFMGQPQADLSCVPLSRHALNLMDVPLISSFVQSSIDAALAEYVAPKSLTLDLKDMLVGDDFKKDTVARGVVMIYIKCAKGFKEGDGGVGPFSGSSDAYMTVAWGKFGKPVSSTRVIVDDQAPAWHEWASILVTPEELNADEKLRLQLWDSDKYTADDDLGRVEVDLHELMHNPKTRNQMCDREDRFKGEDPDEVLPGTVQWRVGYFEKTEITEQQLAEQTQDPNIRSIEDLREQVAQSAKNKLREATAHDESKEIKQQQQEDYKEREDALIISSPPPADYPSGIFSIQIHNITGLEVQALQKRDKKRGEGDREDESEQSDDLPSSYATIILNHQKIYRTRTKPKNSKPFFNAGTERFIRDWRSAEIMVSVRDDRERENDPLLGMVYLPLRRVFEKASQVMQTYPLVGGIGYGRIRISMVWRSVQLKLPKELLGWNYGTLEVKCPVKLKSTNDDGNDSSSSFTHYRMKLRTNLMRAKLSSSGDGKVEWRPKSDRESVFLAVRKRYSSALIVEFRKSTIGPDSTPAMAVLWLKDIPDEEERTVSLEVWKGGKERAHRMTTSYGYHGMEEGERPLGEIELTLKFWRGLSGYHKTYANKGKHTDMKNVMEVLDTANDQGQMDEDDDGYISDQSSSNPDTDSDSDTSSDTHTAASASASGSVQPPTENKEKKSKMRSIRQKKLRTHVNDDSSNSDSDAGEASSPKSKLDPTQLAQKPLEKAKDVAAAVLDVDGHNDPNDGSRGLRAQVRDYKDHRRELHRKHRGVMQWKGARTLDWMAEKVRRGKGRVGQVFEHGEDKKSGDVETEV